MNKKGVLFTIIILIAFLVLFSFVNRLAYISSEYDEVRIAQEELIHVYGLQQNLAGTYIKFIGITDVDFFQNTTNTITTISGNISAQDTPTFLNSLYDIYTDIYSTKTSSFSLTSPLSSALSLQPHGYNISIDSTEILFESNGSDSLDSISLVLFFNTTIDSFIDSQSSDASTYPLINITIFDQNGLRADYSDTLDPTQDNNNILFISEEVEYSTSFGSYLGNDGTLRITSNTTESELYIWNVQINSQLQGIPSVEAFSVLYEGQQLAYNGNLKLAYE